MYRITKEIFKTLFIVMLAFNVAAISGQTTSMTAEAAVSAPSVKESKKTLYTGYYSYTIEFKNLAKSAGV
ncbi:MAG: hypothetical protein ACYDEX_20105, partial [Mobilitalea sp.]